MQKKIIALAVAGLVSGAAFAQSNVTVFGIMDIGYQYNWGTTQDGQKNGMGQVKAGGQDGSRFGFRGTEDLGNGLKANFEMAAGYNGDTGNNKDYGNGGLMSEGAWVGLSGDKWGQVKGGYFGNFIDDTTGIDVTGRIGVSSSGLIGTGKYENFVAYYSPVWSGFQFKAGYSSNVGGADQALNANQTDLSKLNVRAYTAAASYANGGLKLGAAYAEYDPQEVNYTGGAVAPDVSNGSEWIVGAAYDFGVVAISGLYQAQENAKGTGFRSGLSTDVEDRDFWALGLKIPFGAKDSVAFGYGEVTNKYYSNLNLDDDKAQAFTITYLHALSKRTNFYALYGNVNSDDMTTAGVKSAVYSIGGYENAFNVGIRHLF